MLEVFIAQKTNVKSKILHSSSSKCYKEAMAELVLANRARPAPTGPHARKSPRRLVTEDTQRTYLETTWEQDRNCSRAPLAASVFKECSIQDAWCEEGNRVEHRALVPNTGLRDGQHMPDHFFVMLMGCISSVRACLVILLSKQVRMSVIGLRRKSPKTYTVVDSGQRRQKNLCSDALFAFLLLSATWTYGFCKL